MKEFLNVFFVPHMGGGQKDYFLSDLWRRFPRRGALEKLFGEEKNQFHKRRITELLKHSATPQALKAPYHFGFILAIGHRNWLKLT